MKKISIIKRIIIRPFGAFAVAGRPQSGNFLRRQREGAAGATAAAQGGGARLGAAAAAGGVTSGPAAPASALAERK